jgi:hypothetical protein
MLFMVGMFMLVVGVLSLRANRKMRLMPTEATYGPGVDRHILQSGIFTEHGMVVSTLSNELQAQSKPTGGFFEEMLIK